MGFHEVLFPVDISFGGSGGPGFNTNIIEMDSGQEQRIARWENARRKYNVSYAIKDYNRLNELLAFYIARNGCENGFRYKDWLDYSSAAKYTDAPTFTDQQIGLGDTAMATFQLVKKYINGSVIKTRTITKPVAGTVLVALDGVNQEDGWTVDTTTGIVTFTTAPSMDVVITAGFLFHVPVRFGKEVDDLFSMTMNDIITGNVQEVQLVEIAAASSVVSDDFYYGGGMYSDASESISLSILQGRVYNIAPSGDIAAYLPDTTNLPCGGPYFYVHNSGSATISIYSAVAALVTTVAAGATVELILAKDSGGNKIWYAL
jgi:uncharacterized protein (TIGR02217 family)